jgi:hypothetical protein
MAQTTLMPNTATVATGNSVFVSTATTQANLEFVPLSGTGFTGTVLIESSTAPAPGTNDWFTIATLVFSAHTSIVDINLYLSDNPWIRAHITASTLGSISVYLAY